MTWCAGVHLSCDVASLCRAVAGYCRYEFVGGRRWEEAVRLCRFVKSQPLWTCLAGMSLHHQHLDTAEIALAAISEVDKLHYILHAKNIPSREGRSAAMALYRRNADEVRARRGAGACNLAAQRTTAVAAWQAEAILLQASPPLVYRAIKMNIRLFRWDR